MRPNSADSRPLLRGICFKFSFSSLSRNNRSFSASVFDVDLADLHTNLCQVLILCDTEKDGLLLSRP